MCVCERVYDEKDVDGRRAAAVAAVLLCPSIDR